MPESELTHTPDLLAAARAGDEHAFRALVEPHRRELRAYCYRMAGSLHDADDLLQESLLRAWRGLAGFEGRASLRTWLYRVCAHACIDGLEQRGARTLPSFKGEPADPRAPVPPPELDPIWLEPCPEAICRDVALSPEATLSSKESVTLAFLAALQLLAPRQRAILIAREVLGMSAEECAALFETGVPAVNSALQRARQTLDERASKWRRAKSNAPAEEATRALLARYVDAWEKADPQALASLLHEDATLCMPPIPIWLRGAQAIAASVGAMVLTPDARGAFRFVSIEANGLPGLAAYGRDENGDFAASAVHVLEIEGDCIMTVTAFLDPSLFPRFELPIRL